MFPIGLISLCSQKIISAMEFISDHMLSLYGCHKSAGMILSKWTTQERQKSSLGAGSQMNMGGPNTIIPVQCGRGSQFPLRKCSDTIR